LRRCRLERRRPSFRSAPRVRFERGMSMTRPARSRSRTFMRSNTLRLAPCFIATLTALWAQGPDARGSLKIDFPKDSPVAVASPLSADWGQSNAMARGGALLLDL